MAGDLIRAARGLRPSDDVEDRRCRGDLPDRCASARHPDDDRHDLGHDRRLASPGRSLGRCGPVQRPQAGERRRPRDVSKLTLQLWSKPSSYDTYRGALRIYTSSSAPTVSVVDALGIDTYLRGVVPVEMPAAWPTSALDAQSIASRSYAARRLRPGVRSYDVTDDTSSQVYRGVKAERSSTNLVILSRPGVVLRSGGSIANALYHSTGGGGTESNENVYTTAAGSKVAAPVTYLRGSLDRTSAGVPYDSGSPYATWSTASYTTTQVSSWFGADARTSVGTLVALDLRNRGVSGRLISVTLIGSRATKTVSGEVFRSIFNARRPATDPSSGARSSGPTDPLNHRYGGAMSMPRPRCAWAGADGPSPDPLMVAYHDDEWGTPVADEIELFSASRSKFQAGLSWSTILRKRAKFRAAFAGFDPVAVARMDDADVER